MGLLLAGSVAFAIVVLVLLCAISITSGARERTRKVRQRDLTSATKTINNIDNIVNQYYPTTDLVGQAMGSEIRDAIHTHRKVVTSK